MRIQKVRLLTSCTYTKSNFCAKEKKVVRVIALSDKRLSRTFFCGPTKTVKVRLNCLCSDQDSKERNTRVGKMHTNQTLTVAAPEYVEQRRLFSNIGSSSKNDGKGLVLRHEPGSVLGAVSQKIIIVPECASKCTVRREREREREIQGE